MHNDRLAYAELMPSVLGAKLDNYMMLDIIKGSSSRQSDDLLICTNFI